MNSDGDGCELRAVRPHALWLQFIRRLSRRARDGKRRTAQVGAGDAGPCRHGSESCLLAIPWKSAQAGMWRLESASWGRAFCVLGDIYDRCVSKRARVWELSNVDEAIVRPDFLDVTYVETLLPFCCYYGHCCQMCPDITNCIYRSSSSWPERSR